MFIILFTCSLRIMVIFYWAFGGWASKATFLNEYTKEYYKCLSIDYLIDINALINKNTSYLIPYEGLNFSKNGCICQD